MWLVGIAVLLLVICLLCLLIGWRSDRSPVIIWDIAGTARTYTTIVGTLAGFSVTSSIFVANLSVARESAAFESLMALFLIAFLVFISSAMQFATTPNLPNRQDEVYLTIQALSYVLANSNFYLGLCLSWLGLPLLLVAIGLEYLADIFIWLVLFAILGGAMRVSSSGLNVLALVELRVGLSLLLVCFGAAALYRLVATEYADDLLPAEHGPALFAVLCFAVAAAGFSLQSAVVGALGQESSAARLSRVGRPLLVAYTTAVFTTTGLLWFAVHAAV
jgi:hypothetical protein